MSKQVKRKITVNLSPKQKGNQKVRPSVFERLGTKADSVQKELCSNWAQTGTCPYGKNCKYSSTHTLISPSKRLAAKALDPKRKHSKEHVVRRLPTSAPAEGNEQFDPEDLDDADPDDLEKRRAELKRELDIQMKMDKAHKKQKKPKKESSPSSDSSSSSSESSSSSDESSSSSSSSVEARRKKLKKMKKRESSSSSEREQAKKHKTNKQGKKAKAAGKVDKPKKVVNKVKTSVKSPQITPGKSRKLSQTPPPKTKTLTPVKKVKSESKSPRPLSSTSEKKDRHRTPSPKKFDKDRDRERDRKEREKERERDKEREREKERMRDKEKKNDKTPKRDSRPPIKDIKKKGTPDSSHSRDRKNSPPRSMSRSKMTNNPRRDQHKSPPRRFENKRPDSRSKDRERKDVSRKGSRERERDRDRERRIAKEKRDAAKEKDREEALARCQERQRERERLKKLQEKQEEDRRAKERTRREDRGLDKPIGDRVERLLPLPQDRIPPARKECMEKERHVKDRPRRTPESARSRTRKSQEKVDARHFDRQAPAERFDREHDRDFHLRIRDEHRREEKRFDPAFDRPPRNEDRRFLELEHGHPHGHGHGHHAYPEERVERPEYNEERRGRGREVWDEREPEIEHRGRYREDSRPPVQPGLKPRDWVENEYEHEWDNRRRHMDWEGSIGNSRDAWGDVRERDPPPEEEWRHFNRSMDSWSNDDRRRWDENWREARETREPREPRETRDPATRPPPEREPRILPEREPRPERESNRAVSRARSTTSQREKTAPPEPRKELKQEPSARILDRIDRPERVERPERIDRPERPERIERPERVDRPEPPAEPKPVIEPVVPLEVKKEVPVKRPADSPPEPVVDAKKACVVEEPLPDDLSEISDDADEILNRDEEIAEAAVVAPPQLIASPLKLPKLEEPLEPAAIPPSQPQVFQPHPPKSPYTPSISKDSIDENMGMDFEEISEDELEETARMKGLVDALGVDWASLVAESKPRLKPITSAKRRWESHNVLINSGISVELLGKQYATKIFQAHLDALSKPEEELLDNAQESQEPIPTSIKQELVEEVSPHANGVGDQEQLIKNEPGAVQLGEEESSISNPTDDSSEEMKVKEVSIPHPVAAIQVVMREQQALRKQLFASAGPNSRALSARRDLAIRRNLCKLPIKDTYVEPAKSYDPDLFKSACQLFLQRSL